MFGKHAQGLMIYAINLLSSQMQYYKYLRDTSWDDDHLIIRLHILAHLASYLPFEIDFCFLTPLVR